MPVEPPAKRAVCFFDGQNLYHAAKDCFGYTHPNYDPCKLSRRVCELHGWQLAQVRFYTGVPSAADDRFWKIFWDNKLLPLQRTTGVHVFRRELRYRVRNIDVGSGVTLKREIGEEKGIDVRIALDVIRLAHHKEYDVAVIFSQDQDLSEVAAEVRDLSCQQNRWIKVVSAFPWTRGAPNARGINNTTWVQIDRTVYDECIDPRDYRGGR